MTKYWMVFQDLRGDFRELQVFGDRFKAKHYYPDDPRFESSGPELSELKLDYRFAREKTRAKPDILFASAWAPFICLPVVYDLFRNPLSQYVREFSIPIDGIPYIWFAPRQALDLIDLSGSKYRVLPSGTPYSFTGIKLKSPPNPLVPIFRMAQPKTVISHVMVNDEFRDIYCKNGLTGLKFKQAFP